MPDPIPANKTPYPGSARSRIVLAGYWLLLATSTHFPSSAFGPPSEGRAPDDPFILFQHDKASHLIGFGGLALMLILARPLGARKGPILNTLAAAGIALAYAPLDEFTQGIIGHRHVSLSDLLANVLAITAVTMLALTPRRTPSPPTGTKQHGLGVFAGGLSLLALGGLVMAITRTMGREADALHLFAAAALAITLLRRPPIVSSRPRMSAALIGAGVGLTLVGTEVVQAFARLTFSRTEVMFGAIGLLIAMAGWSLRLAFGPATESTPTLRSHPPQTPQPRTPNAKAANVPPTGPNANPEGQDASSRFVGHAVLVSALTLLSRLTGLARDAVLAAAFGLSTVADAFFIGFLVPNLFRRLFGEGALTAAFIPNYTELRERDPLLARRFASLVLTLLTVLLLAITGVAELGLWWAASAMDPASTGKTALALHYTRIMLPYMPLICLVALAGGVLQVHKRFGPPAAAPLVLNAVIIAATLFATRGFSAPGVPEEQVGTAVALGVLVAGVLQLAWQLVVMHRTCGLTRCFTGVGPQVRAMLVMMGPMVLGLAVFQINAFMDALIAFFFAPPGGAPPGSVVSLLGWSFEAPLRNGDVAALQWSQRLYQFPLGVFGIAIATAIFPALSAAAAKMTGNNNNTNAADPPPASAEFAAILRQGLRLTVFIGLPASVGLLLVRVPLARVVYERGAFGLDDALRVATILAGYATSVWAYSMMHTVTRAFYALKDATTPLKVGLCMVALNLTLNLTLIWPLGAAGLAWSTAVSAMLQVAILVLLIRRRVPGPVDRTVVRSWVRTALASGVMAGVLWPVLWWLDPAGQSRGASAALLLGATAAGAAIVLAVAKVAGAEELQWLKRRRNR